MSEALTESYPYQTDIVPDSLVASAVLMRWLTTPTDTANVPAIPQSAFDRIVGLWGGEVPPDDPGMIFEHFHDYAHGLSKDDALHMRFYFAGFSGKIVADRLPDHQEVVERHQLDVLRLLESKYGISPTTEQINARVLAAESQQQAARTAEIVHLGAHLLAGGSEEVPDEVPETRVRSTRAVISKGKTLPNSKIMPKTAGVMAVANTSLNPAILLRSSLLPESKELDLGSLLTPGDEETWHERALCAQTDPEAFFPEKGGSTREAKKICAGCEVRRECLAYALQNDERFGIWGGLSERERRRLKRTAS